MSLIEDLFFAIRRQEVNEVNRLIKAHPEIINQPHTYENIALQYACQFDNIEIVRLLIDKGADVSAKNKGGRISLTFRVLKS